MRLCGGTNLYKRHWVLHRPSQLEMPLLSRNALNEAKIILLYLGH